MKDPARPKSILFRLASESDAAHIEKLVKNRNATDGSTETGSVQYKNSDDDENIITTINITNSSSIGIKLAASPDCYGLIVSEFHESSRDMFAGIQSNYLLSHVNGKCVLGENGSGKENALRILESEGATRPLTLGFVKPYLYNINIEKGSNSFGGPSELIFSESKPTGESNTKENKIVLKGFYAAEGAAESGKVFVGDNLMFVNGIPVGAGCKLADGRKAKCPPLGAFYHLLHFSYHYHQLNAAFTIHLLAAVIDMLKRLSPLALTFARADTEKKNGRLRSSPLSLNIDAITTFSIEATDYDHIGCTFVNGHNGTDIVVRSINGVEGSFQRQMNATKLPLIGCFLESVDDEVVPSYVNPQLIINAMSRRWATNAGVKLTLCNQRHKYAIHKICTLSNEKTED